METHKMRINKNNINLYLQYQPKQMFKSWATNFTASKLKLK